MDALEIAADRGKRFWRFIACGESAIIYQDIEEPTRLRVGCTRCHDRFCLPCSQDRARLIVANLRDQLPEAPTRFLTLTLKHTDEPLSDQLDRLYDSFRNLRRKSFWLAAVTGGAAFLELKLSRRDGRWHPHLHVLIRGNFIPQALLSAAWLNVTGDSHIVDIRLVKDTRKVYTYLTRYVTKGWDSGMYRNRERLIEAIHALKGRKLLTCFGNFTKLKLLEPPKPRTWRALGTLLDLLQRAELGEPLAIAVCEAIHASTFTPALVTVPPDE